MKYEKRAFRKIFPVCYRSRPVCGPDTYCRHNDPSRITHHVPITTTNQTTKNQTESNQNYEKPVLLHSPRLPPFGQIRESSLHWCELVSIRGLIPLSLHHFALLCTTLQYF